MDNWSDKTEVEQRTVGNFMRGVHTLWQLLGDEKKNIIFIFWMVIFANFLNLAFPYILKLIFDELPAVLAAKKISNYVFLLVGAMFAVRIFSIVFAHRIKEPRFLRTLIKLENLWPVLAHRKLLLLSLGYHERENTGKKVSKITKGCDKAIELVMNLYWDFLPEALYLMVNIAIVLVIDWKLGLFFFAAFAPTAVIQVKARKRFEPIWEKWEEKKEESSGIFHQSLVNITTVQNFAQEEQEEEKFAALREEMERLDLSASLSLQNYFLAMKMLMHICFVATVAAGLWFVYTGQSTIGTLVYIIATGNVTVESLWHTVGIYMRMSREMIALKRMKMILDAEPDIKNSPNAIKPAVVSGTIVAEDVSFTYPRNKNIAEGEAPKERSPAVSGINLRIKPGEMAAIVGPSGAGKTTLVRLICRMCDADSGRVMMDNKYEATTLDIHWWRRQFAIVQQNIDLFDDTLLANITYPYPEATALQVAEAVRAAHLEEVVNNSARFPDGLDTPVGEGGKKLSGGERQRVGIARAYMALLAGSRVLVLDEATSNLDSEAEQAIQEMIGELRKRKNISIIAIAHRLSTIQRADVIYVMEGGKIVEQGTHRGLILREGGRYAKLVALQTLKED